MEVARRKVIILEGISNYHDWAPETQATLIKEGSWSAINKNENDDNDDLPLMNRKA